MNIIAQFIYRLATGKKEVKKVLTPIFALLFFFLVLLTLFLALWFDRILKLSPLFRTPWNYIISSPFLLGGLTLWIWSFLQFIKARGTPVPVNPPPKLIQSGPYAYTRNPMLSGVFLMLFGLGLILNSPSLLFFFTPLFMVASILEFKFIEEPELEKRLGDAYMAYKRKTPMLIPRVRKRKGV